MHIFTFVGSFAFLTLHRNVSVQHSIIYKAQAGHSSVQFKVCTPYTCIGMEGRLTL